MIRAIKPRVIAIELLLAILMTAAPLAAQGFEYSSIVIRLTVEPTEIPQGGSGTINITYDVPFGFTVTDAAGVFGISPEKVEGIEFGALRKPPHDKVDVAGGHWGGIVTFRLPFEVAGGARTGAREVALAFVIQACDDETGVCYPPHKTSKKVVISVAGAPVEAGETPGASSQPGGSDSEGDESAQASGSGEEAEGAATVGETPRNGAQGNGERGGTGISAAAQPQGQEVTAEAAPLDESLKNWLGKSLSGGQIWLTLLIVFGAGLLTSLTPCVYPMIPITISYVSGKAQGKKKNGFFISLILVLGMAVTYTVLGVLAAQAGATFGAFGQNIWVQLVVFIVLVVMGFSMLGAFEIGLPASWQQKIQVTRSGYLGALGIGLTIGLVAAPCVAPILIPILALIANAGDLTLGIILMLVYALGMGVLFILLGTFSNIILPRSGEWMTRLKKIFAFVLFLVAIFFARGLIESIPILYFFEILLGAVLVLFGTVIGAFHRLEKDSGWAAVLGKAAGLLLITAGLIFFALAFIKPMLPAMASGSMGAAGNAGVAWVKDLDQGLEQAEREGKPVIVDFWAEWCAACHELDDYTFSDPRVQRELQRFVAVKVDGTEEEDPAYQKAKKKYGVQALPRVVIHDSSGAVVRVFDGFRDADTLLGYLRAVR